MAPVWGLLLCALLAAPLGAGELVGPPAPPTRADRLVHRASTPERGAAGDVAWMASAAAFDVVSSEVCSGCRELHPLARDGAGGFDLSRAVVLKAAFTAGAGAACYALRRRGHHREAELARWTVVAVWAAAGVWNVTR